MSDNPLLQLKGLGKVFPGGTVGLDNVDLDIRQGEFLSLLGPSGCGKTTTLRVIAGFEQPTSGEVLLDGKDITGLRPYDRPVNTVFQDYALFPHMNVAENIGFGLSLRGMTGSQQRIKIANALEMVGLQDKIDARVQALSGGQRQRVALARAIVLEPRVLLLDEPLSALDAHLREQMQMELKRLQSSLGTTFIMVTHDQTEALSISDRIVVMHKGIIEQVATPAELYDTPKTRFVAGFIGTMNLLQARYLGAQNGLLRFSAGSLPLSLPASTEFSGAEGQIVTAGVRPEDLEISTRTDDIPAVVQSTIFHGRSLRLQVKTESGDVLLLDMARTNDAIKHKAGDLVHIAMRPGTRFSVLA